LLKTLVITYHFDSTQYDKMLDEKGRVVALNTSHIDLRAGKGYEHRHFKNVAKKLEEQGITEFDENSTALQNIIGELMLKPQI